MLLSLEGDLKSEEVDRTSNPAGFCRGHRFSTLPGKREFQNKSKLPKPGACKRNLADFCDIDPELKLF